MKQIVIMAFSSLFSCENKAQEKKEYMTIYQKFNQEDIEESAQLLSKNDYSDY